MWTIYSVGDIAFLEQVFIAIAMITNTANFGEVVRLGLLLGVFFAVTYGIVSGGKLIPIQNILIGYIVYFCMFGSVKQTVVLYDVYTGNTSPPVANVPLGAAAAGGIVSLVGYTVTNLFDTAFQPIIPAGAGEVQPFAESLKLLNDARRAVASSAVWDSLTSSIPGGPGFADLHKSWDNYIRECTLVKIDLGLAKAEDLLTEPYLAVLNFNNPVYTTEIYVQPGNPVGQTTTCQNAFNLLSNLTTINNTVRTTIEGLMGIDAGAGPDVVARADNALNTLAQTAGLGQDFMRMAVLQRVYMEAAAGKYNDLHDFASASMINQAIQQRNVKWATEQSMFMTTVRPILTFFEAFVFAITPFMAFIVVLGASGIRMVGKYLMILVWVQLWMPMFSIINLFIHMSARRELESFSTRINGWNWDSFYALDSIADVTGTWIATGGMLASATPAIALLLLYGGASAASNLASRAKGSDTLNTTPMAPDVLQNSPVLKANTAGFDFTGPGGMSRVGQQWAKVDFGEGMSSIVASKADHSRATSDDMFQTLQGGLSEQRGSALHASRLHTVGEAAVSGSSTNAQSVRNVQQQMTESFGRDATNSEAVRDVLSGYLGGYIRPVQAAKSLVPMLSKLKHLTGKSGGGDEIGSLRLGGEGSIENSSSAQQTISEKEMVNWLEGMQLSQSAQAQFRHDTNNQLANTRALQESDAWSQTSAAQSGEIHREATHEAQSFSNMSQVMSRLGRDGSKSENVLARDIINNPESHRVLRGTMDALSNNPTVKQAHWNAYQKFYGSGFSAGQQADSMVLASMQTLSNLSSYGGDSGAERLGITGLANAISISQGSATVGKLPYSSQDFPTQNRYLVDQPAPRFEGDEALRQPSKQPSHSKDSLPPDQLDTSHILQDYQDKRAILTGSTAQQSRSFFGDAAQASMVQFNNRMEEASLPFAAKVTGTAQHASEWSAATIDNVLGSGSTAWAGLATKWQERVGDIQNMTPEQVKGFQKEVDKHMEEFGLDGFIGTILGGSGATQDNRLGVLPLIGSVSNERYETKPDGMSNRDYAAQLALAGVAAAHSGAGAWESYWGESRNRLEAAKFQEARDMDLTPAESQYYATTFSYGMEELASKITPAIGFANHLSNQSSGDESTSRQAALNQMKRDFAGPEGFTEDNGVVAINNKTEDSYVENLASLIDDAHAGGSWAENHLINRGPVNQMRTPPEFPELDPPLSPRTSRNFDSEG